MFSMERLNVTVKEKGSYASSEPPTYKYALVRMCVSFMLMFANRYFFGNVSLLWQAMPNLLHRRCHSHHLDICNQNKDKLQ